MSTLRWMSSPGCREKARRRRIREHEHEQETRERLGRTGLTTSYEAGLCATAKGPANGHFSMACRVESQASSVQRREEQQQQQQRVGEPNPTPANGTRAPRNSSGSLGRPDTGGTGSRLFVVSWFGGCCPLSLRTRLRAGIIRPLDPCGFGCAWPSLEA
ncbi:hypothetical protein P153DRAFT_386875 [Dothidotthia symphoricarpi CBS 119687]|uniref:Uncharacterized protein n=1 Tax=Dothidotthia symphoricarpi CBS 119687 TaxID=1392245 RepID=A0A6A6A7Q9_9PLEO|nr:uncharacterized protein P153DRAFT_386875 [Dothidotthia symphoricarpi CBS 119687]KAF2127899.1 hypothetical protein P153DRAFT_386875 [Dothidotthia symphoricarpi CBS 119687]